MTVLSSDHYVRQEEKLLNNILEGIRKVRKDGATIIYTTHYMEEVEILCDRIIIMDKGKIIASGSSDELKELANIEEKVSVHIDELNEDILNEIKNLSNVEDINYSGNVLVVVYKKGKDNLVKLMDYLSKKKISYDKIFSERPTLNDVFFFLIGKELRD